ncbi:MAG TPA: hypothetical protein VGF99_17185, partial [Myxococcota bacterium]
GGGLLAPRRPHRGGAPMNPLSTPATTTTLLPLLPPAAIVLLVAAALAIVFEAVGAGVGQRKRIPRHHQAVLVVVAGVVVVAMASFGDRSQLVSSVVIALALLGFAIGEGAGLLGERAALALGLAATTTTVLSHADAHGVVTPLLVVAYAAFSSVALTGLAMRADADDAVEAAARQGFIGAAAVILLAVAAAIGGPVGDGCGLVGLALVVGVFPLHAPRLDLAHGASAGVAAMASLTLLALGPTMAARVLALVDGAGFPLPAVVVVVVGSCGLPLVALNQVAVRRLFAVLAVAQGVLPIAAGLVDIDPRVAAAVGAVAVVGLALSRCALSQLTMSSSSWEDVSGIGRLAPWRSGLVIFACAHACGLAPTAGFTLRAVIARAGAVDVDHFWLPVVLLLGAALAALPVVRLALFLFSKTPRGSGVAPARPVVVIGLVVVVAVAVVVGLVPASLF